MGCVLIVLLCLREIDIKLDYFKNDFVDEDDVDLSELDSHMLLSMSNDELEKLNLKFKEEITDE